jgi:hypothetical protein
LQTWTLEKKGEAAWKTVVLKKDREYLSAVEPKKYAKRFQKFMCESVFVRDKKLEF